MVYPRGMQTGPLEVQTHPGLPRELQVNLGYVSETHSQVKIEIGSTAQQSTCCFSRGPEFCSQHLHQTAHDCLLPAASGNPVSLASVGTQETKVLGLGETGTGLSVTSSPSTLKQVSTLLIEHLQMSGSISVRPVSRVKLRPPMLE